MQSCLRRLTLSPSLIRADYIWVYQEILDAGVGWHDVTPAKAGAQSRICPVAVVNATATRSKGEGKLVLCPGGDEGLSLRAERSNLCSNRDCFVALLLAMTPQNHSDGLLETVSYFFFGRE